MHAPVLFVDFSSDNSVRMTLAERGRRPPPADLYHCNSLTELDGALGDYLTKHDNPELMGAAFSVCGWERDGGFDMPNHSYRVERNWIKTRLNIFRLNLVNDCVATALAIERVQSSERTVICDGNADDTQMKAMIAIGRGLGTTCIFTDETGGILAQPCAGGHTDLPATNDREFQVIKHLANKYGHVSRVRGVSTAGMIDVFNALDALNGRAARTATAVDIIALARAGDGAAVEAVQLVTGWLAATASDTALGVGARGGIFLAGSFFDVLGDQFDKAAFAARFCDKGRLTGFLQDIPVFLMNMSEPEMVGLSTLFE